MPKSLGQIHTVNYNLETLDTAAAIGNDGGMLMDISQELSSQLQRNIHQAAYFKCVGIDLTLDTPEEGVITGDKCTVKGRLRYFAPTQGRCSAYRSGFLQMMAQMKQSGINPRLNKMYDFRCTLRDIANYPLNPVFHPLLNLATMNGTSILALTDGPGPLPDQTSLFEAHNINVDPVATFPSFSEGLQTQVGTLVPQTDFVMNEGLIQTGNPNFASLEMEEIPFVLAFDPANEQAVALQWRPDPALYIPLLAGQMEIVFDEITSTGGVVPGIEVNAAIHIAGWKSILSDPRRKSRKSSSKKSTSKGSTSKKSTHSSKK